MVQRRVWTGLMLWLACLGALLFNSGCGLRHGDHALAGNLRIETSPARGPLFQGIKVQQQDDKLLVSGYGRRSRAGGHVEISLINPDGETLARVHADLLPPLPVPNRGYNYRFRAVLTTIPSAGSILRIVYVYCSQVAEVFRMNEPDEYSGVRWARSECVGRES